ncbi:MAG TPA: hypothetical protein VNL14_05795 [Candidatus Acidoferrales bacterium]|nr:hypothetical protein [Candidatus Acidoferrales bacterium]
MLKCTRDVFGLTKCFVILLFPALGLVLSVGAAAAQAADSEFTTNFRFGDCKFKNKGANAYFILQPGYQLVLEGQEDGEQVRLVVTVLKDTETVDVPGLGRVKTRVVEERESVNGDLVEVSRNFFAICDKTNDVVYFGEEVDICEDGLEPNGNGFTCNGGEPDHSGAWRAGVDGALPGIIMPGTFLLGSRYFQELAPNAMDQAEHVEMGLAVDTAAGTFDNCVKVVETTPLEPGAESEKIYCPGVGLTVDDVLVLVQFGRNIVDDDD